jgi:hypothetical protein
VQAGVTKLIWNRISQPGFNIATSLWFEPFDFSPRIAVAGLRETRDVRREFLTGKVISASYSTLTVSIMGISI